MVLYYLKHLFILVSVFGFLAGIPVGFERYVKRLKVCAATAGIKNCESIKHEKEKSL